MRERWLARWIFFWIPMLLPLGAWGENNSELEALTREALRANPEVHAAAAEADAARARIPQASAWEDPRIGFQVSNLPSSNLRFDSDTMTGKEYRIEQTIPFPGKLGVRKKAARADAEALNSLSRETANRIRFQVTEAYFKLYRIDKGIETVRKNKTLSENLANVAEARFATATVGGPDVFRAQTFESMLANELLTLQQERTSAISWLNTLLGRDPNIPIQLKYRFEPSKPPKQLPSEATVAERPLLQALENQVEAAEQQVRLARRDFLPDFDLGFAYHQRDRVRGNPMSGSDLISAGVMLNIPLWAYWRQNRQLQESKAREFATQKQYEALRNQTRFASHDLLERLQRQHRQLQLYRRELLPQTRAAYETSFITYEAQQNDFFSTLEALKDQFEMERAYYELIAAYETDHAELEWVTGQRLESKKMEDNHE